MSDTFGNTIRDLSGLLRSTYNAHSVVYIPGSGTYAMEAVARQIIPGLLRLNWFR